MEPVEYMDRRFHFEDEAVRNKWEKQYNDDLQMNFWWNPHICMFIPENEFDMASIREGNQRWYKMKSNGWECYFDEEDRQYYYIHPVHDSKWTWEEIEREFDLIDTDIGSSDSV